MGSPSMDEYAGYEACRLDILRGDTFAVLHASAKTHDWNVDRDAWLAGYKAHLFNLLNLEGWDKALPGSMDREFVQKAYEAINDVPTEYGDAKTYGDSVPTVIDDLARLAHQGF